MTIYNSDEISIDKISEEIKAAIDYPNAKDILKENFYFLDATAGLGRNSKETALIDINNSWKIETHWTITSHRPIIGKLIVIGKKIIRKISNWYVQPIVNQQTVFNAKVTRLLNDINSIINNLIDKINGVEDETLNLDYLKFENQFRGDESIIEERSKFYLNYFLNSERVLDIGCGRGELLKVLKSNNINAQGIDVCPEMVQYCIEKGLKAVNAEATEFLFKIANNSLDGICILQVVEHLTPAKLVKLIHLCYEKLAPGGCIIIETPNPQSLSIYSSFFYVDMSHIRPVHHLTLKFLLESAGYSRITLEFINPLPVEAKLSQLDLNIEISNELRQIFQAVNANFSKLNNDIYGYQDYMIVAYK